MAAQYWRAEERRNNRLYRYKTVLVRPAPLLVKYVIARVEEVLKDKTTE